MEEELRKYHGPGRGDIYLCPRNANGVGGCTSECNDGFPAPEQVAPKHLQEYYKEHKKGLLEKALRRETGS